MEKSANASLGRPISATSGRAGLRFPIAIGCIIIALFFGALGGWAALAPLESAAIAPGEVAIDTKRKTVQHLEGGIIGEILVRDGDVVDAGQVLIRLEKIQSRAELELLQGRHITASAIEARLIAERDGLVEVPFPEWLLDRLEEPEVIDTIAGQVNIFASRQESLDHQTQILRQRIAQFDEEITGLEGQITAENVQLELIGEESEDVRRLVESGLARRPRLLSLEREAAALEGRRSQNLAGIARARQSISEARLRISELRTAMVNEVVQQLSETQAELFDLADRIRASEDKLARMEVRAPIEGTIVNLQVHTLGGVIAPGAPLLDIVPSDDSLVIEARVDPGDIDVVRTGLNTHVRISAFSQRNMAPIPGVVTYVSADRLNDERTGVGYYVARIMLEEKDVFDALQGAKLQPGMQAEVIIATGARTVLDAIISPLSGSFNRAFRED
ncbi:MAG: HlyD family type I secretion periplasmic adaptor subunit [Gammaproteobacteria bacterium]